MSSPAPTPVRVSGTGKNKLTKRKVLPLDSSVKVCCGEEKKYLNEVRVDLQPEENTKSLEKH